MFETMFTKPGYYGRTLMTTYDQALLDSLAKLMPLLTPLQKEKLLSFGEEMATVNRELMNSSSHCLPDDETEIFSKD